jgi:hypothetical protein
VENFVDRLQTVKPASGEWASPFAVALLDELLVLMMEATLVLRVLSIDVPMNFDELLDAAYGAAAKAHQALGAAYLLNQGAALDASWTTEPSRPKAIWARHMAEVKRGAVRIHPEPASCERIFRADPDYSNVDSGDTAWLDRPRCAAVAAKTGKPCLKHVLYVGSSEFTRHCERHVTPKERAEYLVQRERIDLERQLAEQDFQRQLDVLARAVVERWLHRRFNEERSWDTPSPTPDGAIDDNAGRERNAADD